MLARLEKWLAAHRPRYLRNLRPGANAADLDALERSLGVALPADLRDLLSWHNGQGDDFAGALVQSWLLMSTEQILIAKQNLDEAGDQASGWITEWIPFLDDDAGDYVCVDTGRGGAVREYWSGNGEHPVIAASLRQWLEEFVAAVERGEYVEDPERGRFLKKGS